MFRVSQMSNRWTRLAIVVGALIGTGGRSADSDEFTIHSTAASDSPYGFGEMVISFPTGIGPRYPSDLPISVSEQNGRVLYPAVTRVYGPASADGQRLSRIEVRFLFLGDDELRLAVVADRKYRTSLPIQAEANSGRLKKLWWSAYRVQLRNSSGESTSVETYLLSMLGRRLKLPMGRSDSRWRSTADSLVGPSEWTELLALLTGTTSVRTALQRDTLLRVGQSAPEQSGVPLPEAVVPPPIELPEFKRPQIEAIANRVPAECFYIRCGRVSHFGWLGSAAENFSALLGGVTSPVTVADSSYQRLQAQLGVSESREVLLFGDAVLRDMAMIGTDLFVGDGAAVGFLFEVEDARTVDGWLERQRTRVRELTADCIEETIEIDGHQVSFLHTPDNRIRSFLVADGRYRLLTTSRFLARRFLETGRGVSSLGKLDEFAYARSKISVERRDPIFVYLSDPFFRLILGPQYRVEMTRRVRARGELELVELARLASRAEGQLTAAVDQLVRHDFLPSRFGQRFDGSRPLERSGQMIDSLRGAAGTFLPVPDVEIDTVSVAERDAYQSFAREYARVWQGQKLDPVVIAIWPRADEESGLGRVAVDVLVTPFAKAHYPDPTWFAAPVTQHLKPVDSAVVLVEFALPFQWPVNRAFLGIEDFAIPFKFGSGSPDYLISPSPEQVPFFVGTTAHTEFRMASSAASNDQWTVQSERSETANRVLKQLHLEDRERPSQLVLQLGKLGDSKLRPAIEAAAFALARQASGRNVSELHRFAEQFRLQPRQARGEYERLLQGRIVCPLGGDYRLVDNGRGKVHWTGTFWPHTSIADEHAVPESFRLPLLDWLQGMQLELTLAGDTLISHIEVTVPTSFLPEDVADVDDSIRLRRQTSELLPAEDKHVVRVRELGGSVVYGSAAAVLEEPENRSSRFPATLRIGKDWTGELKDWPDVAAVPGLERVLFDGIKVDTEMIGQLASVPDLAFVEFRNVQLSGNVLVRLSHVRSLRTLRLQDCMVTAESIEALANCARLERIVLLSTKLDRPTFDRLTQIPALQRIEYDGQLFDREHFDWLRFEILKVVHGQKASWSSDGKRLAYSVLPSGRGINIVNLDTRKTRTVVHTGKDPAWRPGHDQIAYVVVHRGRAEIRLVGVRNRNWRKVADGGFPSWSADGQRLYYHTREKGTLEVLDFSVDDSVPEVVARTRSWFPALSPDGTHLAHLIRNDTIAVKNLATGESREFELPHGPSSGIFADWSPDHAYLAFGNSAVSPDASGLWLLDVESGDFRRIVERPQATMPSWSADGRSLAFDIRQSDRPGIFVTPIAELGIDVPSKRRDE